MHEVKMFKRCQGEVYHFSVPFSSSLRGNEYTPSQLVLCLGEGRGGEMSEKAGGHWLLLWPARCKGGCPSWVTLWPWLWVSGLLRPPLKLVKTFRDAPALVLPSHCPALKDPKEWGTGVPKDWPPTFQLPLDEACLADAQTHIRQDGSVGKYLPLAAAGWAGPQVLGRALLTQSGAGDAACLLSSIPGLAQVLGRKLGQQMCPGGSWGCLPGSKTLCGPQYKVPTLVLRVLWDQPRPVSSCNLSLHCLQRAVG